ncbi:GrpE protein homolog, mitochondrial [Caenorhabditis elegans]|uniref:GrpE protein homolog, mitochondrial n=1 Tax=Caenorhabditis elegans TaxID=6239 RepID=GRPE_CAEEL|nr:GrpE protein homolog, mitochondrial [Caenorhabditis elegans]Q18421.1 RecName: Full=GrpE protein homolog, mitochondrial; Flags: Precursor [Caenorhabditis elegans]CAA87101.1 GrpE protein homolog, mitochondrial [Caenorhabditis elegans]|eukprot:NP_497713.1 GrpE protein homolog, mitochondrial [Caenorhabditis elegans]
MLRKGVSFVGQAVQQTLKTQKNLRIQRFSATASQSSEEVNYEIRKDGKRLRGADYEEIVLTSIAGEDKTQIPKGAFDVLLKEYDDLQAESLDFKDKYQRSLAETENVRRRGIKQTDDAKVFAIQSFCKDLLEVSDILDIAVKSVKPEDLESGGKALKDLFEGVSMTRTVMAKTFAKHGLVTVDPTNEKFDPNLHEAVFQIPSANAKQPVGHIEVCTKIGYSLKERPIRPAQVGVVSK